MEKCWGSITKILKYLIVNALFWKNFFGFIIVMVPLVMVQIFNFQNTIFNIFGKSKFFFFYGKMLRNLNQDDAFFHDEI